MNPMKKLFIIAIVIVAAYQVYVQSQPKLTTVKVEAFMESLDRAVENQDYKSYKKHYDLNSKLRYINHPSLSEDMVFPIKRIFKTNRSMWKNDVISKSDIQTRRVIISKNNMEARVETAERITLTHHGRVLEEADSFSVVTIKLVEEKLLITDTEIRGDG